MAGNSQRRGAIKKSGKGNPTAGSGGRRRKGLEGKGPTPKAEDRPYHKKHKMAQSSQKRQQARPKQGRDRKTDGPQWVAGRNSVLELLQAEVPLIAVYVAEGIDRDQKVREILDLAVVQNRPLIEIPRNELDTITSGVVHQGVAAKVESYEYSTPQQLLNLATERDERPLIVVLDGVT
ncbi:MAG: 23S rRNA (guanosine(2251)-2'-O)-methyltransferase RlmB, partial [Actinomycetales bacterium]|nr:23S rRNA (guanosine(2251)-2'-O)-methyltransferase RlmB [Actinomycetales bacterium]